MTLRDLSPGEVRHRLRSGTLLLPMGPLLVRIQADDEHFADAFHLLYSWSEVQAPNSAVADIVAQLVRTDRHKRAWVVDGRSTGDYFVPELTFASFEWTMHEALAFGLAPAISIHAAVACRDDGSTVALVGRSGSGKSTLAAGLITDGWRLVADEFLVIDPAGTIIPVPAVITLKGHSIDLIRPRLGHCVLGPLVEKSFRGPIAHLTTPLVARPEDNLQLRAIVFPYFRPNEIPQTVRVPRGEAIIRLGEQSHNFHVSGPSGFRQLAELARTPTHAIRFTDLQSGIAEIGRLMAIE